MIKIIHRYFRGRFERFYFKNRWHLVLDLSLIIIVICLTIGVISLYSYRPNISWLDGFSGPTLDLNNPPLDMYFSSVSGAVKMEEGVPLKISFQNNGAAAISNLKINLAPVDKAFVLTRLELAEENTAVKINGRELTWTAIPVGQGGEVNLKAYFTTATTQRQVAWQAHSEYIFSGKLLKHNFDLPSFTRVAALTVKSVAYYTSPQGDQLGIGPLPPIVGIPTSYWIFWEAASDGEFKNLVFSARLPENIELAGDRSLLAGEFDYNADTRQIIWKIAELTPASDSYRFGFEVRFIPEEKHVGQSWPLLTMTRYYAKDALTGEEKTGSFGQPTTDLLDDHFNNDQGRVVSQ
jgi:hypothetical protein